MKSGALILTSLASFSAAFYLPGIMPKSYTYNDKLPISMSLDLTSNVPHSASFSSKKGAKPQIYIFHDTLLDYDFCDPENGFELHKVKHSSTMGFFSNSIISSAYSADMRGARLPIDVAGEEGDKPGSLPRQAGEPFC